MAAKDLCTAARVSSTIGGTLGNADVTLHANEQATIALLITSVSDAIEKYCRRSFYERELEERYDGVDESRLLLREYPIIEVDSVTVDGVELSEDDEDFLVDQARGVLYRRCGWCAQPYGIVVEYTAGYATIPEAIVEAAAEWVALLFYRTKRDPNLNNAVETNAYGFNALSPDGKPPGKVRALLAPYRRLVV